MTGVGRGAVADESVGVWSDDASVMTLSACAASASRDMPRKGDASFAVGISDGGLSLSGVALRSREPGGSSRRGEGDWGEECSNWGATEPSWGLGSLAVVRPEDGPRAVDGEVLRSAGVPDEGLGAAAGAWNRGLVRMEA